MIRNSRAGYSAGFTLIEMLVTVAIVGILATISFPLVQLNNQREREFELRSALRDIRTAIDSYKRAVEEGRIIVDIKGSGYPPDLKTLVDGVADAKSTQGGQKLYFLRRLPMDPMIASADQVNGPVWGLRSYSSPANDPQPGLDVYDVFSTATGTGLNGVPYRDW